MAVAGLTAACLSTVGPRAALPGEGGSDDQDAQSWPEGWTGQRAPPGRYQGTSRGQRQGVRRRRPRRRNRA